MWILFLRPVQGFSYFKGDVASLNDTVCEQLIDAGFAREVTHPDQSDLPKDLPGRAALIRALVTTKKDVLAIEHTLTEIDGIGKKTAEEIIKRLKSE